MHGRCDAVVKVTDFRALHIHWHNLLLQEKKTKAFQYINDRTWKKIAGWKKQCQKITGLLTDFWWNSKNEGKCIHWGNRNLLCKSKDEGDMGFRDLSLFNDALLSKQFLRIFSHPNLLTKLTVQQYVSPKFKFLVAQDEAANVWIKPEKGYVKINCDASCENRKNRTGIGIRS
ncbi:hypothetical protein QQ045_016631 [Rhodiola kirilowii]